MIMRKLLFFAAAIVLLAGCSKGNNSASGKDGGWYVEKLYSAADFTEWNQKASGPDAEFYVTFDEKGYFIQGIKIGVNDNGVWTILDEMVTNYFIHIVNDKQMDHHYGILAKDGSPCTVGKTKLYSINAGGVVGNVSFYSIETTPFIYTREGDIIKIYDGKDVWASFIVNADGLIMNGVGKWPKYDPSVTH